MGSGAKIGYQNGILDSVTDASVETILPMLRDTRRESQGARDGRPSAEWDSHRNGDDRQLFPAIKPRIEGGRNAFRLSPVLSPFWRG
jgi:hypothetical protein